MYEVTVSTASFLEESSPDPLDSHSNNQIIAVNPMHARVKQQSIRQREDLYLEGIYVCPSPLTYAPE